MKSVCVIYRPCPPHNGVSETLKYEIVLSFSTQNQDFIYLRANHLRVKMLGVSFTSQKLPGIYLKPNNKFGVQYVNYMVI